MKHISSTGLLRCVFVASVELELAQVPVTNPVPAGKLAARPLFRDPSFDAPTDPVLCFDAEAKKWFMYYTARRATATNAPGVTWVHGSNIGMRAEGCIRSRPAIAARRWVRQPPNPAAPWHSRPSLVRRINFGELTNLPTAPIASLPLPTSTRSRLRFALRLATASRWNPSPATMRSGG